MKKLRCAAFCVLLPTLFTSCATLDAIKTKISGGDTATKSISGATPITKRPRFLDNVQNQTGQGTKSSASGYQLPESYDEAYSYRTDSPYKNVAALLKDKNVESLRVANPSGYIKKLCEAINAAAKNDFEKAKMAHDAVCLLVSYDAKNFWAGTVPAQDYASVIKTKTEVCEGYANTFKQFCAELQLRCEKVTGYARGVGTTLMNEGKPTDSNHAWNLVCLNNAWYLVDCTWDSGHMEGKSAKQDYNTDWLFLRPEHFIYTHYPDNTRLQLLTPPLSPAQFSAQASLRPKFFEVTSARAPLTKTIATGERYSYAFTPQAGYVVSFRLVEAATGQEMQNCTFVTQGADGNGLQALFSFPKAGTYSVMMFYRKIHEKTAKSCGEFLLEARGASSVRYPTTFASSAKDVAILSPLEMPLAKGKSYHFALRVEGKKFVAVVCGKTFIQLTNDGNGVFSGDVTLPSGIKELSVTASNSEKSGYETLVKYSLQ